MNPTSKTVLVSLLASTAALAAYHVTLAPGGGSAGSRAGRASSGAPGEDELAVLRRELASLREELRSRASVAPGSGGEGGGAGALAARLAALEARLVGGDPTARSVPSGVGEKSTNWSEQQIADFRSMLEAVELRRTVERETVSFRQLVASVDPNLSPADVATTTSLLQSFMRTVRGVFADPKVRETPEDYAASMAKAKELRGKLLADLREVLRAETVEKIMERMPSFDTADLHSSAVREWNAAMDAPGK